MLHYLLVFPARVVVVVVLVQSHDRDTPNEVQTKPNPKANRNPKKLQIEFGRGMQRSGCNRNEKILRKLEKS